jgi:hypothetical protein
MAGAEVRMEGFDRLSLNGEWRPARLRQAQPERG